MKNIKEIITQNLITLRKQNKLTQIELAKKINYSDKAISRWENGEVLPDVEVLQQISEVYNIPITYLFEKHTEEKQKEKKVRDRDKINKVIICVITMCIAWMVATVGFVCLQVIYGYSYWQAFVWAVPTSCLIGLIYLQLIDYNFWLIFLIGIPVQAALVTAAFLKLDSPKQ